MFCRRASCHANLFYDLLFVAFSVDQEIVFDESLGVKRDVDAEGVSQWIGLDHVN